MRGNQHFLPLSPSQALAELLIYSREQRDKTNVFGVGLQAELSLPSKTLGLWHCEQLTWK